MYYLCLSQANKISCLGKVYRARLRFSLLADIVRLINSHIIIIIIFHLICLYKFVGPMFSFKVGFHYPSSRAEFTGRVHGPS